MVGGLDQSFHAADGISRSSSCCGGHQRCYLIERSVFFNTAAVWQRVPCGRTAGRAACFRMRSQKKQKSSSRKQNNVYQQQQQQPCRNGSGCCCWVGVHGVVYGLRFFLVCSCLFLRSTDDDRWTFGGHGFGYWRNTKNNTVTHTQPHNLRPRTQRGHLHGLYYVRASLNFNLEFPTVLYHRFRANSLQGFALLW